jgi:uncharacterized protein YndB with AHSA1/START domain
MNIGVNQCARALADLGEGSILAVVEIAAPCARVFKALSSEEITSWWGSSDTYHTTHWIGDVRPGGKWQSSGVSVTGETFSVGGEYLEVSPPHRLVHTWIASWDGNNETTVSYHLESVPNGTRLTLRHIGFDSRTESCAGHANGWERVLGWLASHLSSAYGPSALRRVE